MDFKYNVDMLKTKPPATSSQLLKRWIKRQQHTVRPNQIYISWLRKQIKFTTSTRSDHD